MSQANEKEKQVQQQVTLVLRGDAQDITDVIQLALAGGLLQSMTQDKSSYVNAAHVRRHTQSRTWVVGQRVQVTMSDKRKYPDAPPVGTEGTVTVVHSTGLKSAATVRFNGTGGKPHTVRLAGRMLKAVKS
jgi:hypothetical protein